MYIYIYIQYKYILIDRHDGFLFPNFQGVVFYATKSLRENIHSEYFKMNSSLPSENHFDKSRFGFSRHCHVTSCCCFGLSDVEGVRPLSSLSMLCPFKETGDGHQPHSRGVYIYM